MCVCVHVCKCVCVCVCTVPTALVSPECMIRQYIFNLNQIFLRICTARYLESQFSVLLDNIGVSFSVESVVPTSIVPPEYM